MILKLVYNTVACIYNWYETIYSIDLKSRKLMQTSVSIFQVLSSITGNQHLFIHWA